MAEGNGGTLCSDDSMGRRGWFCILCSVFLVLCLWEGKGLAVTEKIAQAGGRGSKGESMGGGGGSNVVGM